MAKRKGQKQQTIAYKTLQRTKDWATWTLIKISDQCRCFRGEIVPAPAVTPGVLLVLKNRGDKERSKGDIVTHLE
jgi:hypothetical protein